MKESKKQYRIGHVAHELGVEKFVIRFWEKEFNLVANRSDGGQRFYEARDIDCLKRIKNLLYDQGLTIAGARKLLENPDNPELLVAASQKTTMHQEGEPTEIKEILPKKIAEQMLALQKQLIKLKEVL